MRVPLNQLNFRAAILERSHEPLVVDEITFDGELLAGQVLVQMTYSGICGTQLHEIDASKGPDKHLPHLLGHEGFGTVVTTGPLVRHVRPGDPVVLHWMPGLGIQSDPARYLWRGQQLNAGWVTTLSRYTVVSENRCTPIHTALEPWLIPLLGCGATTAAGAIGRDARLIMGESLVVLGTGGVGLLAIEAGRASGAFPIVGVDRVANRLKQAIALGAASVILSTGDQDLRAIVDALEGRMPDVVIETTGAQSMIELGYKLVAHGGRCILVGVPHHDSRATIHTLPLHFGSVLAGTKGGATQPHIDIPRLARLSEAGLFRLNDFPVQLFTLDQINEAIQMLRTDLVGRAIIDLTGEDE